MNEYLDEAKEELKRVDHLIYVSLKFTRTVDVLKSIVERMISTITFVMDALLLKAKDQGKINEIPKLPSLKRSAVEKAYDLVEMREFMEFYVLLRKIDKAVFEKAQEFRRHVTMTAVVDGQKIEVTIDIINEYFKKVKEFVTFAEKLLGELEAE